MKLLDVRGRRCPMLLADLTREMRDHLPGHTVEVLADKQSIVDSLVSWCRESQHSLVSIDTIDGDLRLFIRKGPPIRVAKTADGKTGGFPVIR